MVPFLSLAQSKPKCLLQILLRLQIMTSPVTRQPLHARPDLDGMSGFCTEGLALTMPDTLPIPAIAQRLSVSHNYPTGHRAM
jgi:phage tail protein X